MPVRPDVVRVVVQVAGEHQLQVGTGRLDDGTHEVVDRVVRARLLDRLDPARRRRAQDHLVARVHQAGHLVEVLQLGRVDVRPELRVDSEQPPAVRELDREVRPRLRRPPATDPVLAVTREQAQEGGQAVVPVVVAGQGVQRRLGYVRRGYRQGRLVRPLRPVLVLLVARRRVHLVAAHDQYPPARQRRRTGDRQLRLGEQVGDRVRRVEPVADVGHVVEPRLAIVGALVEDGVRQRLLQFALVQVCTEPAGQDDAQRGDGELPRGQPRYRAARGEPELLGGEAARAGLLGVDSHGIGGYPNPLVPVRRGSRTLDRRCRLSSVGQSDALVMRRSSVRFRQAAQ